MGKNKLPAIFLLASSLIISGCVARTYNLTRDRVDQDLSPTSGNRGYLMGNPPEDSGDRKATRTTRVFEIELGVSKQAQAKCPSSMMPAPVSPSMTEREEEPAFIQETETLTESAQEETFEIYTVDKNDTLQKISSKFYGTTKKWPMIYKANKNVLRSPDKLYVGQTLKIPVDSQMKTATAELLEPEENLK